MNLEQTARNLARSPYGTGPDLLLSQAEYEQQILAFAQAVRAAALEEARDVEPMGGDHVDTGGWHAGFRAGCKAKMDAIGALRT
jgi:hypothetical protein